MISRKLLALVLIVFTQLSAFAGDAALPKVIDITYKKYVLKNGLTLIVHEDRKAPIVAVNVWYHVGSKNEKPGRTGFAHLFEHLMFNGSENFNDDFFKALDQVGASGANGTTNEDRTNYFENAPKNALDFLLWLESDRMGHFAGAISQERLDEQRGVVQNEKRQGENQPYGRAYELITKSTYPANHPYSWTVIGSMEDLNAASLDDVKDWFRTYYGAANSVLVVAGDVNPDEVHAKVQKYFGDIPSGPPISKHENWIAKRSGSQRQIMQDRVPQARIYKVWNVPQFKSEEADYLDLFSSLLTSGKNSRLYNRLVYKDQIATSVSAYLDAREIGSQFHIVATARPGEDLAKLERILDEELNNLIKDGPSKKELERVKIESLSSFIRGAERIGGFGGKSDILAMNQVYADDPDYYKVSVNRVREATPDKIRKVAQTWLTDGVYTLEVHPFPEFAIAKSNVDRSKLPVLGEVPDTKFPELQRAQLKNGLKVILAERHSIPVVTFSMILDAGYAADSFGIPGTAKLAMNMLDEGTKSRSALEISEQLQLLGANMGAGSGLDTSSVFLSALKANLADSLELYADVILNPSFPQDELDRLKKQQIDAIQREKVQPVSMAMRVLPQLLYGEKHAYSNPLTGSGTEESTQKISREDIQNFYKTWFKADNATIIVVGDTTMDEVKPRLEKLFGDWKPGEVPAKNIATVEQQSKNIVYLLNRPDSIQSIIFASNLTVPRNNPNEVAIRSLNEVFGGQFTARLNMNLREDKHWSYGAQSAVASARGQRPFYSYASVQSDKTKESMAEIAKELGALVKDKPVTEEELGKTKKQQVLELAGNWETMGAVSGSISEIVAYGLPDDYYETYAEQVKALDLESVRKATEKVIHLDRLIWVIVGDLSKIEPGIRELGFGEIRYITPDGKLIERSGAAGG
ncbi:MAG: M16 family metallopeptidase, partial [Limisphaerales bacterium]